MSDLGVDHMTTGLATLVLVFIFMLLCDAAMFQIGRAFRERRSKAKQA